MTRGREGFGHVCIVCVVCRFAGMAVGYFTVVCASSALLFICVAIRVVYTEVCETCAVRVLLECCVWLCAWLLLIFVLQYVCAFVPLRRCVVGCLACTQYVRWCVCIVQSCPARGIAKLVQGFTEQGYLIQYVCTCECTICVACTE